MLKLLSCGVLAFCLFGDALAAPDEIMVYTEEMNEPGQFGLEQHLNYSIQGTQVPEYPGQMTPHHVLQATPEFSYGISNTLEAGLYLPVAFAPDGNSFINGVRLRLKYIAPKTPDKHFFYGLNVEAGQSSVRVSESALTLELRPIIGYRDEIWLLSFNPILSTALSDNVSHQPQIEPALKLTHRMGEGVHGGIEYYGAYGTWNQMLPAGQVGHTVYAVLDSELHGYDINFGIGRGLANASDDWVVKSVFSLPF
jgi:hypothetical protein